MMQGKRFKKLFFLVSLSLGYQTTALCFSTLEYILGGSASLTAFAMLYYNSSYRSHSKRFAQQGIINEAYDSVQAVGSGYHAVINAFNTNSTIQAKSDAIGVRVQEELLSSKNHSAQWWLENVPAKFRKYRDNLTGLLNDLNRHKARLTEKKNQWSITDEKELLNVQMDTVIGRVDSVVPALKFVEQELPYRLCLAYRASAVEQLAADDAALAGYVNNDQEFKSRLERRLRVAVPSNIRFPYTTYCAQSQRQSSQLAVIHDFLKDWKPRAHQQPEQTKRIIVQLEKVLQDLKNVCASVRSCAEFKNEAAIIEAEHRAREAERRAEEARREAERKIREMEMVRILEQQRAEQRARDAENRARQAEQRARDMQNAQWQRDVERRAQENAQREADRRSQENAQRARDAERYIREAQERRAEEQRIAAINQAAQLTPVYDYSVYNNTPKPTAPPMEECSQQAPAPSAPEFDDIKNVSTSFGTTTRR